jgi:two-component system, OmpR family, sensor histidine kinase KdpD
MEKHIARAGRAFLRYVTLTAAACLMVVLFRKVIPVNQTTVALSFLVLILVTASRWRLTYSVYLSLLCTLCYNFFFLPPVGKLTIADPENWVTLAAFLCTSVLVSHLAEKEHREAETSEARRREVEVLYKFSQQLLLQEDPHTLARNAPSIATSIFGFRAAALYVRDEDTVYYSDPDNELLPVIDLKLASGNSDTAVVQANGLHILQLSLGIRHALGVLAVTDSDFSPGLYEAIGSLVSIALGHAVALERSSRLEASRESERLRSALLDSVTHDLRTPLTSIRAAATTLASHPELLPPERTELVTVVDEESARLDRIIGQAVEMAQLDANALHIHLRPQNVRELIELTVEEMRPILRHHPVEMRIPEELPAVPMDRTLVHRVLRHLLENAVKYSPAGYPITVTATKDDYRLLISVADQGPGIDLDEQSLVFEKFFRGRRQQSHITGTGMGLAIARAILNTHGGGIELASSSGEGARFTFWLPLTVSDSKE